MSLRMDKNHLLELLQDFHTLTGIRIAIFDDNFQEILNYPASHCDLCKIIRDNPERNARCESSNRQSFDECKQRGSLVIYNCHAGLIEATAPIKANGVIIGYIMIGQITDCKNKDELVERILEHLDLAKPIANSWVEAIHKVKYKSRGQIRAAAKILEALTFYVLQKDLISLGHTRLVDKITDFIENNLDREISTASLAARFGISRTALYELTSLELGMGIASYVRRRRLEKAKTLLVNTAESVTNISCQVGFDDATNFAKAFKREYRLSPSDFRNRYYINSA